jgi:hypothetical protein
MSKFKVGDRVSWGGVKGEVFDICEIFIYVQLKDNRIRAFKLDGTFGGDFPSLKKINDIIEIAKKNIAKEPPKLEKNDLLKTVSTETLNTIMEKDTLSKIEKLDEPQFIDNPFTGGEYKAPNIEDKINEIIEVINKLIKE